MVLHINLLCCKYHEKNNHNSIMKSNSNDVTTCPLINIATCAASSHLSQWDYN